MDAGLIASAAGAVLPSLLLLYWFYRSDRFPEPPAVLFVTFALGVATVGPLLLYHRAHAFVRPEISHPVGAALYSAFFVAAVPEELFKFLVVRLYSVRRRAFDEPMDGLVYGAVASLGFATYENVQYVAGGGWPVALARALTGVPAHAAFGTVMGYQIGQWHGGRRECRRDLRGYVSAVLLHAAYDFPLFAMRNLGRQVAPASGGQLVWRYALSLFFILVLFAACAWTYRAVWRLSRAQLDQSVARNAG